VPRPPKTRRVEFLPPTDYFKPAGVPLRDLEEVVLAVDEFEALRLKDGEGLDQEACADRMKVSRPTLQRILSSAREKVARALVGGHAIRIEGGAYRLAKLRFQCQRCGEEFEAPSNTRGPDAKCPSCDDGDVEKLGHGRRGRGRRRRRWETVDENDQ